MGYFGGIVGCLRWGVLQEIAKFKQDGDRASLRSKAISHISHLTSHISHLTSHISHLTSLISKSCPISRCQTRYLAYHATDFWMQTESKPSRKICDVKLFLDRCATGLVVELRLHHQRFLAQHCVCNLDLLVDRAMGLD
eukprot:TRINITY_DN1800_c0_g1_i5.p1 TRINITY_DN1800_c0_g1~~TRINITY_DN1800_c0_g1_i5.p1  ORF type:complete len:139 (-),score=8.78 TRINITY_DN1800_c0_g1_i5:312-728(-)